MEASNTSRRVWPAVAAAYLAGYGLLRLSWAAGGRWGYTACDRRTVDSVGAAALSSGCGAAHARLSFWTGWGTVGLCALALVAAVLTTRRWRGATAGAWAGCAVLVALSFPAHLVFEIPAALAGHPTDWRDMAVRCAELAGGLLLAAAASAASRTRCEHRASRVAAGATGPAGASGTARAAGAGAAGAARGVGTAGAAVARVVPRWARGVTWAAGALPVVGWTVPHLCWILGIPLGMSAAAVRELRSGGIRTPVGRSRSRWCWRRRWAGW